MSTSDLSPDSAHGAEQDLPIAEAALTSALQPSVAVSKDGSAQLTAAAARKRSTAPLEDIVFEEEFVNGLKKIFEEMISFNRVLGLKIHDLGPAQVRARIEMKPELVGHFSYNRIHGGVISAGLDAMGGLAVMAAIGARHMDEVPMQRLRRFANLGTIDLRIDYLRPGIGAHFDLHAQVLRLGSRVASTRMEFFGPDGTLLSTGSGAYIVS
jgi:uncharacterized protein (TIGR00369 family)